MSSDGLRFSVRGGVVTAEGFRCVAPVGAALRLFGEELARAGAAQSGSSFTDIPAADEFVRTSPEAFLLGVLFTQGIPAERAWAGPYLLRQRLGHLDLHRLVAAPEETADAVAEPPALHRFVKTLPGWITSAARRLIEDYEGSAARVWRDGTDVREVMTRLLAFEGIGEKKAAMTVSILTRHFRVPLGGAEHGSIAYDVHVRRVFLRAGLVQVDTPRAVHDAARNICPHAPATLDLAAWLVGREWCRPTGPRCDACRLGSVCPRHVDRCVEGVGVRRPQSSERKSRPESSFG